MTQLSLVFLGLAITSSWGNGHATRYRGSLRELARCGHDVLFLEHDEPHFAANRALPYGGTALYGSREKLEDHRAFYNRQLPEDKRRALGENARRRVLLEHTPAHRAEAFESYLVELTAARRRTSRVRRPATLSAAAGGQS